MILTLQSAFAATPIGTIEVTATERGITSLAFVEREKPTTTSYAHLQRAVAQIREYFAGERRTFSDLPLALIGTVFSQDVWRRVLQVPYGSTLTYGRLAVTLGKEGAARAVGGAVGRNPLAIIVPCHRVVGTGGEDALGGYAWGRERKRWLLEWEKRIVG